MYCIVTVYCMNIVQCVLCTVYVELGNKTIWFVCEIGLFFNTIVKFVRVFVRLFICLSMLLCLTGSLGSVPVRTVLRCAARRICQTMPIQSVLAGAGGSARAGSAQACTWPEADID